MIAKDIICPWCFHPPFNHNDGSLSCKHFSSNLSVQFFVSRWPPDKFENSIWYYQIELYSKERHFSLLVDFLDNNFVNYSFSHNFEVIIDKVSRNSQKYHPCNSIQQLHRLIALLPFL